MNLTLRYGTFHSPFPLRRRWQAIGAVKRNFESLAFFGLACAMKAALCEWAGSFPNHNGFKAGPGAHAQEYEWFGQLCFYGSAVKGNKWAGVIVSASDAIAATL
jgi:hypothetical protein